MSKANKPVAEPPTSKENEERPIVALDRQSGQTLKELANRRREARERMVAPVNPRKALSAKSTNEDVTSPVKNAKAATGDCNAVAEKPKPRAARERAAQKIKETESELEPVEVPVPSPSPPAPAIDVLPSTETVSMEAALLSPASPEPTSRMSLSSVRDTPPPADISSHGETSRPSRRARAAISYAEPNLRDKMRRPTKELYDAVNGQTRYLQRSGSAYSEKLTAEGLPIVKRESSEDDAWKHIPPATSPSAAIRQNQTNYIEPVDKMRPSEPTYSAVKPDRKKRTSSMMSGSISESEGQVLLQQTSSRSASPDKATMSQPIPSPEREVDPYEFTSSTPGSDTSRVVELKENNMPTRQSKSSRRLSSVMREDFKVDNTDRAERSKPSGPRKRASMVLPKRTRGEVETPEDSSFESVESGDLQDARSKVSMRRRSMML